MVEPVHSPEVWDSCDIKDCEVETEKIHINRFRSIIEEELQNLNYPQDDEFLLKFIHAKKFNLERAVKLLNQYYEMRRKNPKLFQDLTPRNLSPFYDHELQVVLRERDEKHRKIFVFRAGNWDPLVLTPEDIFRCNYLVLEEMTNSRETQKNGIVAIVDFKGFSFFHARNFTPTDAKKMVQIIQGSFPCKFKEFHLVNQPYIFQIIYAIVKPFLSAKIQNRIFMHGENFHSLHEVISCEMLPDFLGGNDVEWKEYWNYFRHKMLEKENYYAGSHSYASMGLFPEKTGGDAAYPLENFHHNILVNFCKTKD